MIELGRAPRCSEMQAAPDSDYAVGEKFLGLNARASRDGDLSSGEFDDHDGLMSQGMESLGLVDGGMEQVD